MLSYSKPFLPLRSQLQLLKQRGLEVSDDAAAIECLHRIGYYRLSAYWYPFREFLPGIPVKRANAFLPDSRFNDVLALYVFDRKLKLLLLDAVERVEIAVRVDTALLLGARHRFAHTMPQYFHRNFTSGQVSKHSAWLAKFDDSVQRSRDEFVLHYESRYGSRSPLPIWIAIELWDFGTLSRLFAGMKVNDRQLIATRFSIPD